LIMQSDVMAARQLGLVSPGNAPDPNRAVLSILIDRALVLAEVDRYAPPEPSVQAIESARDPATESPHSRILRAAIYGGAARRRRARPLLPRARRRIHSKRIDCIV